MAITELTSQRNTFGSGQLTTVTFTYPGTPTSGNLLVAAFAWRGNVTVSAVPSGWNLAASTGNGTNIDGAIYYKIAGSSEPTTAQWTLSGSQKAAGVASEWSGIHATPLDASNGNTGTTSTILSTNATGVLSQANELVINLFSARDTVTFNAFGQSQTTVGTVQSTGGTTASRNTTLLASEVVSSTTSVDYTAQIDSAQTWVAAVATFKEGASDQTLTPSLYTDSDTFHSATVGRGAVTLTPPLFTDGDTFHSPTASSLSTLTPSLVTNSSAFFAATVIAGAVTLSPPLFSDTDSFHTPEITSIYTLEAGLFEDGDGFYAHVITSGELNLSPSLFENTSVFHSASVTAGEVVLSASLYDDEDTFFAATISSSNLLEAGIYVDDDVFDTHIALSENELTPELLSDDDVFYNASISSEYNLTADKYNNNSAYFGHSISVEYSISPSLFQSSNSFYLHSISSGEISRVPVGTIYATYQTHTIAADLPELEIAAELKSHTIQATI